MKKIITFIGTALLLICASLVLIYVYASGKDFYFKEINTLVNEIAGYELEKSGPLEFGLWPHPTLTARELKIINPVADRDKTVAKMADISLSLHWLPLLWMELNLDGVDLLTRYQPEYQRIRQ